MKNWFRWSRKLRSPVRRSRRMVLEITPLEDRVVPAVINVNPSNYLSLIYNAQPGDTVQFAPGNYTNGLNLSGMNGAPGAPITFDGSNQGAVIWGTSGANTVEIDNASYLTFQNFTVNSNFLNDGIKAQTEGNVNWVSHDITIKDNLIENAELVGNNPGMTVGINTKCTTWNWVIEGNTIDNCGTGLYLGNPNGSQPFINGVIEGNTIENTIMYGMEIKDQAPYSLLSGMPSSGNTIIANNNWIDDDLDTTIDGQVPEFESPSLMIGGFPASGPGSNDMYQIYGNLLVNNQYESLLQVTGRASIHDNVFVDSTTRAIAVQPHPDGSGTWFYPEFIPIYDNTIYDAPDGIDINSGTPTQVPITGNLIFANTPINFIGGGTASGTNLTNSVTNAGQYVVNPTTDPSTMNFTPLPGQCQGPAVNLSQFSSDTAYNVDFKGATRPSSDTSYGAYEAATVQQAPAAPTGLSAAAGNAQVALTWNASSGATNYNVYRGSSSGGETLLASGVTGTSYTDSGLTNGDNYYYTVTAVNSAGASGFSNEATAWPQAPGGIIWVEDGTPIGATLASDGGDAWTWGSSNPAPYSGSQDQQSNAASGEHQHYFTNATQTMAVGSNDTLYAWVYLNPSNPPQEIMLQWNVGGSWEHRAYWGADDIDWGSDGTVSRAYMGALPATGGWVRLAVPASAVGLAGQTVNGMAFTLYGGQADFDQAGTVSAPSAPTGLAATAGSGQVALSWTASSGASAYNIYRGTSSGTEVLVASGISGTSYTNTGLTNGTDYYYVVTAANGNGESAYSNEVSATPKVAVTSSAAFVKNDAATQGNWQTNYGADGYDISQYGASLPSYATVNLLSNANYTWATSTTDGRDLQEPGTSTRIAACWYSASSFTINVNLTDGQTHQVALYALDWDDYGPRQEQIQVEDAATGTVLDTETVSNFNGGQYLVWNVKGDVNFVVTNLVSGSNAVISGIFFGGPVASTGNLLSGAFNREGIVSNGSTNFGGGLDGGGTAYSANLLGSSVSWNGQTFTIGTPNTANVVSAQGQTINLPAGSYSAISFLGTGVDGSQGNQTFTVTYTDGTTQSFTQSFSDWFFPQGYAGETKAVQMAYRDNSGGGTTNGPLYLYGYSFALNSSKTVESITLPSDGNVELVSAALTPAAATNTSVNLSGSFNREGIVTNGTTFGGGLDGDGNALSANLLGPSVDWKGQTFQLGTANTNNVVSAQGQTIDLPAGNFTTLSFLAVGVNGNQPNLTFTVTYTDGTTQTFTQSISDWYTPQNYAGESTVVSTAYRDTSGGGTDNRPFNVYGYQFALNSAKTVQSIILPNDSNVEILAMNLTS